MVELSEWLTDVALVYNQLIAKRSHDSRGATAIRKLNDIQQSKIRKYVTKDKNQDFINKCMCCNKGIHKLWN